jgi:hypothetical protein
MAEERKELFSQKVAAGSRTYFIDVKESKEGTRYLVISESRRSGEGHEHERVMIFEENFPFFANALDAAFEFLGVHTKNFQKPARFEEIRKQFLRAYEKWTAEEDERLRGLFNQGKDTKAIAEDLQRQPGAISSRLAKLGLVR